MSEPVTPTDPGHPSAETNVLRFRGVRAQRSKGVQLALDIELGPGVHVFLGDEADGPPLAIELACGLLPPRRGEVTMNGTSPYRTPKLRAQIGSLLAVESLPKATTTAQSVQRILDCHRSPLAPAACLDSVGLGSLLSRHPAELSAKEQRGVATAVALSLPNPRLLALQSPLQGNSLDPSLVAEALRARAAVCPVLVATTEPMDSALLGGTGYLFSGGVWTRTFSPHRPEGAPYDGPLTKSGFLSGTDSVLVYTPDSAALVAHLSPLAVQHGWSLHCDTRGISLSGGPLVELCRAVLGAQVATGAAVQAVDCGAPSLQSLKVSIEGYAQGVQAAAYQQSYYANSYYLANAAPQAWGPPSGPQQP